MDDSAVWVLTVYAELTTGLDVNVLLFHFMYQHTHKVNKADMSVPDKKMSYSIASIYLFYYFLNFISFTFMHKHQHLIRYGQ